ncbi:DUF2484 family protein [Jannaschia formosa]|uniref:DUF2484 family protein n=1 Tax=Jannaschia formosa TaxID=2259592 RepID=UPI000E1BFFEA|nr:DUF2484 family protein [Jannaschia formosa]TFL17899.1 DUF2484 family protein [Jannaschia formosa]
MALVALCLWVVLAWLLMVTLTARQSWPAAYGLIALGLPLLGWLGWTEGWVWTLAGALVMGTVLRWPVRYAWRWVRTRIG